MTLRIALAAAAAAAPLFLAPTAATAAPACTPAAVGRWCFDNADPTDLPCIEGNFDPFWVRLVECPS
jgi:hypothetical protein